MGFITPDLPDVDHETWHTRPVADRMQVVTRHWVEHGFGTPSAIYLLYVFKMAAYAAGAAAVISLTPGLGGLGHIGAWWTQPIVYQKLIIFTLLFEVLGVGLRVGPAHRAVLAADRRIPVLVAAQDNSSSALAARGSVHQRRHPQHF